MGYIGKIPSAVPLTSADITDNVITSAKIVDGTIALADLSATGTKDATTFLRGDNTFASAGAAAGQVIQVVTATDSTPRSTTSTSFVTGSNTLSVSITPASISNKILLFCDVSFVYNNIGDTHITLYRGATNLGSSTGIKLVNDSLYPMTLSWYDTPSSTSSLTYQVYFKATAGTSNINYFLGRTGTWTNSIIAMEVKG